MLKKYTIYGERCSGTNYLQNIINANFDVSLTWKYGHKHFFGFQNEELKNSDDTLFICIVRNLPDWINSFYRTLHHLPILYKKGLSDKEKLDEFLNKEFFSVNDYCYDYKRWDKELLEDRNIYTGKRYKNIFELRHTKLKWLIEDLPNKVKNYVFIRHEDLLNDFKNTLIKIKKKGLKVKDNIEFPINIKTYKNTKQKYVKKQNKISTDVILNNPNIILLYENKLYNYKS